MIRDEIFDFRAVLEILQALSVPLRQSIYCIGGSSMAVNPLFSKDPHLTKDIDFAVRQYDDLVEVIANLTEKFPQIKRPDYGLDETIQRGLPYTLVLQQLKIDLFGENIYGIHLTPTIEGRSKQATFPVSSGLVSVNYLADNDLLLFKMYASLTDSRQWSTSRK